MVLAPQYMVFAVSLPLICGVVMTELLRLLPKRFYPQGLSINLYNSGIATLTIGSIVRGALDIYGTENPLVMYYAIVGIGLVVLGILAWIISISHKCEK